jgi:hypothetical protein
MDTAEVIATLCRAAVEPAELGPSLEPAFAQASDAALAGSDGRSARLGIAAGQVAIRLGIARKALDTAASFDDAQVKAINRTLAQASVLDALGVAGRLLSAGLDPSFRWGDGVIPASPSVIPAEAGIQSGAGKDPAPRVDLLANICRHHREHERFYVHDRTTAAADLAREANKLKIVADAWQRKPAAVPDPAVNYTNPLYAPAGCPDLNEVDAIAMIGVLFMEGEGEPIEIKVLKGRLTALAAAWRRAGEWLGAKMEAAWDRERAMYAPNLIAVAPQRFHTIVTNWRGSRERLLAARALEMALRMLDAIPFEPARIRQDRASLGRQLHEAGEILAAAAQLVTRTAADLADNDPNWTDCIRHLGQAAH